MKEIELLGCILSSDLDEYFFTSRMIVEEGSHIVDFVVDDDPTVGFGVVFRNFSGRERRHDGGLGRDG